MLLPAANRVKPRRSSLAAPRRAVTLIPRCPRGTPLCTRTHTPTPWHRLPFFSLPLHSHAGPVARQAKKKNQTNHGNSSSLVCKQPFLRSRPSPFPCIYFIARGFDCTGEVARNSACHFQTAVAVDIGRERACNARSAAGREPRHLLKQLEREHEQRYL